MIFVPTCVKNLKLGETSVERLSSDREARVLSKEYSEMKNEETNQVACGYTYGDSHFSFKAHEGWVLLFIPLSEVRETHSRSTMAR